MTLRVAHVVSARGVGGAERFLATVVREGISRRWEQLVVNPFAIPASSEMGPLVAPVPYHPQPWRGGRSLLSVRGWLGGELADFRPHVVHVLLFHAAAVLATLPRAGGGVRVATNVYGEAVQHLAHARLREPIDRWAGRHVDHTIAISEAVERFLIGHYGYRSTSVSCIPLGWEGHPLPRGAEPRPPTIVSVAKLRPEKGHVVLVAAFQEVARQLPDARLVLVGDGPLRASLEQQIEARGLTSSVVITGSVPDVWTYLADADVFALASTTEAYGIAVAEAMAAGLPVVASAVGGIPELVVPAVTGQLFSPGDSSALASHLVTILRSSDRGAAMGAAGREAAEPHRLSRSAARYADAWERLAARADVRR